MLEVSQVQKLKYERLSKATIVRNVHIVNSISRHTKPLSVAKSDCSRNVRKPVICKSLQVKPLNVSKSISSCNARSRNFLIVNSIIIPNH